MATSTGTVAAGLAGLAVAAAAWTAGTLPGPSPDPTHPVVATAAPPAVEPVYRWPTGEPVPVLRPFDRPAQRWASGHRGADLDVDDGTPVHAAADGVVAFAGVVVDRPVLSISHPDGIRTTYEPVRATVAAGAAVRAGDVVGFLAGPAHCADRPCLHWGARRGADDYVDPLGLLAPDVVIRLLPG